MKIKLYDNQNDLVIKLNSIAVALMVVSSCITGTLARISMFAKMQNNIFVLGLVLICMFTSFLIEKKARISFSSFLILAYVSLLYLLTLLFNYDACELSVMQFMFYALIPVYLISQTVDGEYVLRYCLYISFITLPVINSFFNIQYEQYAQAYMGNIYSIITPVIVALIHFKLYFRQSNIVIKLAYIYNLYILFKMLLYANRGAVICVLFCIIVLLVNAYDGEYRKKIPPLKLLIIIVLGITALLCIIFAQQILIGLASLMGSIFKHVPSFITKMIKYMGDNDVGNGRTLISEFTMDSVWQKPLFGHGIGTFQHYAEANAGKSWPYPHQYILQYLFEGGILFSIIPIYLSLSLTAKVIFTRIKEKKEFALCCVLVCSCLPKLLFSTDPWASTTIWMLIAYSLNYIIRTNQIPTPSLKRIINKPSEER